MSMYVLRSANYNNAEFRERSMYAVPTIIMLKSALDLHKAEMIEIFTILKLLKAVLVKAHTSLLCLLVKLNFALIFSDPSMLLLILLSNL